MFLRAKDDSLVPLGGVVYIAASNGFVYCLQKEFKILWQSELDSERIWSTPALSMDGKLLLVVKKSGEAIRLNASTGERIGLPQAMSSTVRMACKTSFGLRCSV